MKIGLIVPGGVDRSGEYRVIPALLGLIARLSQRHQVHVFALRQEARPGRWDLCGARIHNIGARATVARTICAIRAEHSRAAFQLLHAIFSSAPGFIAVSAGKLLRIPCALHVAGGELLALRDIGYGGRISWKGRLAEAATLKGAAAVTAASLPMLAMLARRGITASRVPLGVDLNAWPPLEPRRRKLEEVARLVHVASLNRVKDQSTLLHALARLAERNIEFRMDIVGEDTLGGEIQALTGRLKLCDRVKFHGFLPQRQLRPLVESAHLLVVSSRHEAGPLAVLEAAVAGVPTVGTEVGHITEWSPQAAVCVPVSNPQALASAIGHMLDDEDQRLKTAWAAHRLAIREDADFTAQAFESLYERLVTACQ